VIARGLERKLITLEQGQVDKSLGLPAADGIAFRRRAWGPRAFVVLPGTLVDLDHWFHGRVVVAPIGAHARSTRV
jgi:hypothetical protein